MTPRRPCKPHPANAPGDFYVEDGCCIFCGIPEMLAPTIFGWVGQHCIVAKQPETPAEIDEILYAVHGADADCIRYRGNDPEIARRMAEMGHASLCDEPPPEDAKPLARTHVTFRATNGTLPALADIVGDFMRHWTADTSYGLGKKRRIVRCDVRYARVEISWHNDVYHPIEFAVRGEGEWLAVADRPRIVEGWLQNAPWFEDVRWYSSAQWRAGGPYRRTVV